ncbi:MAG: CDP-alcohol phosphatidyltransferase family protein [Anaerolineales bacterium]
MLSRWIRTWYGKLLRPFLFFLARLGITANILTISSLIVVTIAGILFTFDQTILGAWILLLGGFLDGIDGELARVTQVKSTLGGFLQFNLRSSRRLRHVRGTSLVLSEKQFSARSISHLYRLIRFRLWKPCPLTRRDGRH